MYVNYNNITLIEWMSGVKGHICLYYWFLITVLVIISNHQCKHINYQNDTRCYIDTRTYKCTFSGNGNTLRGYYAYTFVYMRLALNKSARQLFLLWMNILIFRQGYIPKMRTWSQFSKTWILHMFNDYDILFNE